MHILIEHACPLCKAITKAGAGPTNTHIEPLSVGAHLTLDSKMCLHVIVYFHDMSTMFSSQTDSSVINVLNVLTSILKVYFKNSHMTFRNSSLCAKFVNKWRTEICRSSIKLLTTNKSLPATSDTNECRKCALPVHSSSVRICIYATS